MNNRKKTWLSAAMLAGLVAAQHPALARTEYRWADDTTGAKKAPKNWFNLDASKDKVQGVGTEKAYKELLKGRPSRTVVVAIIDSGVDIEHEDLQGKVWINEDEIPNNGIDDDKNGYVDDRFGWNFIGGKNGSHVHHDNYEATRIVRALKPKYEGKTKDQVAAQDQAEFDLYQRAKEVFETKSMEARMNQMQYAAIANAFNQADSLLKLHLNTDSITLDMLDKVDSKDGRIAMAKGMMKQLMEMGINKAQIQEGVDYFANGLQYGYNLEFDPRSIVGDNYADKTERYYGNNDVKGPDASHGTHVAGIVAANRQNAQGMAGIADNVKIMAIRAVPDGDERDKDVANAIRYAVDNGAQIINMSFGKQFSPEKALVDEAIRYAEQKGVLLVHAAGNESLNTDEAKSFPHREAEGKGAASNWLEIGALSWKGGEDAVATFSNYGQKSVDIFAPGVDIYSTMPSQKYANQSGTSMAAPVTSGVAALLMSYFPKLSASDVKNIILQSATKQPTLKVKKPSDSPEGGLVEFGTLSATGGVVNAYEAVRMAEKIKIKNPKR